MVTLELMRQISAAFNSRDVERIVDCFAEGATFCLARGPEPVGRTLTARRRSARRSATVSSRSRTCAGRARINILAGDHAVSLWIVRARAPTARN